ncbi:unnamed protein product [Mytilus edulis]|uniref:DZIP3-like HEPN domain-containing protein n=1 Tax=Mytilus edulis TaxID=6550 RepID=A0A8S3VT12_MYTED|nr:unnamed protein product [Mytilus edulis]
MMAPSLGRRRELCTVSFVIERSGTQSSSGFFDSHFPPTYLSSTLNTNFKTLDDLKFRKVLTLPQWNLLFPTNGAPDSRTFDVTLMICVIRRLTGIAEPINGYNRLPLPMETTPGADLARIKWYRNILAHESYKMVTADFITSWSHISEVSVT